MEQKEYYDLSNQAEIVKELKIDLLPTNKKCHSLKIEHGYFEAVLNGKKTYEIRRNDRGFKLGELLRLRELDAECNGYTGRFALAEITHITSDKRFCKEGYVVMGIKLLMGGRELEN